MAHFSPKETILPGLAVRWWIRRGWNSWAWRGRSAPPCSTPPTRFSPRRPLSRPTSRHSTCRDVRCGRCRGTPGHRDLCRGHRHTRRCDESHTAVTCALQTSVQLPKRAWVARRGPSCAPRHRPRRVRRWRTRRRSRHARRTRQHRCAGGGRRREGDWARKFRIYRHGDGPYRHGNGMHNHCLFLRCKDVLEGDECDDGCADGRAGAARTC